jgi:hypothetical protein
MRPWAHLDDCRAVRTQLVVRLDRCIFDLRGRCDRRRSGFFRGCIGEHVEPVHGFMLADAKPLSFIAVRVRRDSSAYPRDSGSVAPASFRTTATLTLKQIDELAVQLDDGGSSKRCPAPRHRDSPPDRNHDNRSDSGQGDLPSTASRHYCVWVSGIRLSHSRLPAGVV